MSEQGDDPLEVAAQAPQAVDEGRFAVVPEQWSAAVGNRSTMLVSGEQPALPTPTRR